MGMGYIRVKSVVGKVSIHLDGEFWIFLVMTVILLLVTFGSFFCWQRSRYPTDRRVDAPRRDGSIP